MAIAYESQNTQNSAWGNSLVLNKPSGTAEGDVLVCSLQKENTDAITAPSGWTLETSVQNPSNNEMLYVYTKRAGASEPASYTWSWTNATVYEGCLNRYSGCVSSGSYIDATTTTNTGGWNTSAVCSSVTTATNGAMLVGFAESDPSRSATAPSGFTERFDNGGSHVADGLQATAGASGNKTFTLNDIASWATIMIALKPASTGETGTGALTLPKITASGSGIAKHHGTGAITLPKITASGSGKIWVKGTGSITLPKITISGSGIAKHHGTGALTLPKITISGSGTIWVKGTGALTLPKITISGSGIAYHKGTGAITLPIIVASGSGTVKHIGAGALVLPAIIVSGSGKIWVKGTGSITLPKITMGGSGIVSDITGTGNITLSAIISSGIGVVVNKLFTGNTQIYTCIIIYPNSADNWTVETPFGGYLLTTESAFILPTIQSSSFVNYKKVPGKLLSFGTIKRSVDIYAGVKKVLQEEITFNGIGGVSKTSDFTFELENVTNLIDPTLLLGREIKVMLGIGTTAEDFNGTTNKIMFVGKIYDSEPSRNTILFTARGKFQTWDKEIGTISNNDSDVYRSSIYPMTYGDFSDAFGFMPVILDKNMLNIPKLILDNKALKQIDSFYCWDESAKKAYLATNNNDSTLNSDNNEIQLISNYSGMHLTNSVVADSDEIKFWNPPYIVFALSSIPSPALEPHTPGSSGVEYFYASESLSFEYIGEEYGYYLFTCGGDAPVATTFSLTKVGFKDGPTTLNVTWHSVVKPAKFLYERPEPPYSDALPPIATDKKSIPTVIKVEDEYMQLVDYTLQIGGGNFYQYTRATVARGYRNTTAVYHTYDTLVYEVDGEIPASNWLVKHTFPVRDVSGLYWEESNSSFWDNTTVGQITVPTVNGILGGFPGNPEDLKIFNLETAGMGDTLHLKYTTPETASKRNHRFNMDLIFDKISLDGRVSAIFLQGWYSLRVTLRDTSISEDDPRPWAPGSDIVTNTNDVFSSALVMLKGGMTAPLNHVNYTDKINGWPAIVPGVGAGKLNVLPALYEELTGWLDNDDYFKCLVFAGKIAPTNAFRDMPYLNTLLEFDSAWPYTGPYTFSLEDKRIVERDVWSTTFVYDYNGLINNINQLNNTRYSLQWQIFHYFEAATRYADFNIQLARMAFLIHFYVDPLKTQFWIRGKGRIWVAGYLGYNGIENDLIENPVGVIEDIARREIGLTDADLDFTSFNNSFAKRQSWKITFSIYGENIRFYEILDKIAQQHGLLIGETSDGYMTIDTLDIPESIDSLRKIYNVEIMRDSSEVAIWESKYTSLDRLLTKITMKYQENLADNSFVGVRESQDVIPGIDNLLENAENILDESRIGTLELDTIRDVNTVDLIANLVAQYYYKNLRIISFTGTLSLFDIRVGTWLYFENDAYIKGTIGNVYLVIAVNVQLPIRETNPKIQIEAIEFNLGGGGCNIFEVPSTDEEYYEVTSGVDPVDEYYENISCSNPEVYGSGDPILTGITVSGSGTVS